MMSKKRICALMQIIAGLSGLMGCTEETGQAFDKGTGIFTRDHFAYITASSAVLLLVLLVITILMLNIAKKRKLITRNLQLSLDSMTSILNKSDVMIYVTDTKTDEILFINEMMKQHLKIDSNVIGRPCYRILQEGKTERCSFCPCRQLDKNPDKVIIWEDYNSISKKYYRRSDQYADWPDGRKVHIQHCVDITDIRQKTETLKKREIMMAALNKTALKLLSRNMETFDTMMSAGIRPIVDLFDIDRFSFFRNVTMAEGLHASLVYRWDRGSGSAAPAAGLHSNEANTGFVPNWEYSLKNGNAVNGPVSVMPGDEAAAMKAAGTASVFVVPVFSDNIFWGFVMYEDFRNERHFDDDSAEIMRSAAFLCSNAVIRNEMEREINKANERARILLDKNPLCCQLFDANFKKIDCNEEAVRLFGFKDKQEYLDRYHELFPEFQGDGSNSGEKIEQYLTKAFEEGSCTFEWTYRMLDGSEMPSEIICVRVRHEDGYAIAAYTRDLRQFNKMMKDISEKSAHLELALEQAKAASKAKGNFLSAMSHEMRTPMNAIIGMTAIGKKANNIEGKNHALNKIGDASSHLLGVINDVLDMAKIEANKLELAPVEFNFERMLQRVTAVINFKVDEKQQQLTLNIDSNIPNFLVGDDQRLAQVIANLLSNAVKFTPEGGKIQLDASLLAEKEGECELRIEVADNGIGISEQQQEKLFGMFEQAESGTSRKYGGTGLGLVLSKNIVELMNGKVWIESELGNGARFIFTVKMQRGMKNLRSLLSPGIQWENVRILAVDDIIETHNQFHGIFDGLGIQCGTASNGFEACRMIEEHGAYDIYFIDWRMPGMDGIELIRKIKSRSGSGSQFAVIMVTAMDWELIKDEAIRAGADKYLLKPLFSSAIIDCANECLASSRMHEDAENQKNTFAGKRMLLAEDMEINREIFLSFLEDTGVIIDCAKDGIEALDMIKPDADKYDIVFMDVQMPKMDGLESTRRIRAIEAERKTARRLPIIAMTANVFKDDIDECFAAGMDGHIGKPIDIDKVLEIMHKYLETDEV